jgi:O-antigen/teichoic acid export membrane protein
MLEKILKSELFKVSLFTGFATLVKMVTAYFLAKVIAVYLGPSGLGVIGQLSSFLAILAVISTGAINNGIVKNLASIGNSDFSNQQKVIKVALVITFLLTSLTSLALVLFATFFTELVFGINSDLNWVFLVLAIVLIFQALFSLFSSILNGLKAFKIFNFLSIISSITSLLFCLTLIHLYGKNGALLALVSYQAIVCVFLLFIGKHIPQLEWKAIWKIKFDYIAFQSLAKFSLMTLISAISVPVVQLVVRKIILINSGSDEVGFYEGMNRISSLYLSVITTTFSVYYLPKLSELGEDNLLGIEIRNGLKIILPVTAAIGLLAYATKSIIIRIVLTPEFNPISTYFLPQAIGDFFRVASWLIAFVMIAKSKVKMYIITEIVFSITMVLLAYLLVPLFGGIGSIYAYMVNMFFYLITMLFLFKGLVFRKLV